MEDLYMIWILDGSRESLLIFFKYNNGILVLQKNVLILKRWVLKYAEVLQFCSIHMNSLCCGCDDAYVFSKILTVDGATWSIYRCLLCQSLNLALCLKISMKYIQKQVSYIYAYVQLTLEQHKVRGTNPQQSKIHM